jgi:hypothetical protein
MQAIRTGWVHPNINIESPESELDMNVIVGSQKQRLDIKVALSNSFGFGGHNSSVLFAPYEESNEVWSLCLQVTVFTEIHKLLFLPLNKSMQERERLHLSLP